MLTLTEEKLNTVYGGTEDPVNGWGAVYVAMPDCSGSLIAVAKPS